MRTAVCGAVGLTPGDGKAIYETTSTAKTHHKQVAAGRKTAERKMNDKARMPPRPGAFEGSFVDRTFPHRLGGPRNLRALQQIADGFRVWAEMRFRTNCPSMFLASASVTPEGVMQLVRHVTTTICQLAPPILPFSRQHRDEKRRRLGKPNAKDSAYIQICTTLNGFALLESSLKTPNWVIERAAPGVLSKIDSNQGRLTAVQALSRLHTQRFVGEIQSGGVTSEARRNALNECLLLSVAALEKFVETDLFRRTCPRGNATHARFSKSLHDVINTAREGRANGKWAGITELCGAMQSASEQWIKECLPLQKRGHVNNQRKAVGLRWRVAYVCQYARLLEGNDSLDDLVHAVMRLSSLCEALVRRLRKMPKRGGVISKPLNKSIFREYDLQVLKPRIVNEWRRVLGENATAAGVLVKVAKKTGVFGLWSRELMTPRVFSEKNGLSRRIGDGKRLTAKTKRRLEEAFVDDLLVPMQVAGLVARVPWDSAWTHARNPAVPLKTHKSKKWVLNPFGLLLAGDEAG